MSEDESGEIPSPLKGLRKVSAPGQFETKLHEQLHALPATNRWGGWFFRPGALAVLVTGGLIVVAALLVVPSSTPTGVVTPEAPVPAVALPVSLGADSLAADSTTVVKTDVNTSKLP